jgi:hypothetical protein
MLESRRKTSDLIYTEAAYTPIRRRCIGNRDRRISLIWFCMRNKQLQRRDGQGTWLKKLQRTVTTENTGCNKSRILYQN